jgi:hypothetical protein
MLNAVLVGAARCCHGEDHKNQQYKDLSHQTQNKERMVALEQTYTIEISYSHLNLGNHPDGGGQQGLDGRGTVKRQQGFFIRI